MQTFLRRPCRDVVASGVSSSSVYRRCLPSFRSSFPNLSKKTMKTPWCHQSTPTCFTRAVFTPLRNLSTDTASKSPTTTVDPPATPTTPAVPEGYSYRYDPKLIQYITPPPGCTVVQTHEEAERVLKILMSEELRHVYHACDTETTGIDPKIQSPVGNGQVICLTIYCGPNIDFGTGPRLWIDNYGGATGLIDMFKEYLEEPSIKKVWHNYSFDRHIIYNHGINVLGFGGDTMHMARLWNSARTREGGYSLESLSKELVADECPKTSMHERFALRNLRKDGSEGLTFTLPDTVDLQTNPDTRTEWAEYAVRDAQATWHLRARLEHELEQWPWTGGLTMFDFYVRYWLPFGEMLTDMERNGIYVLRDDYLPSIRVQAEKDKIEAENNFLQWAQKQLPECKYMNPSSEQQKQQFFFGPREDVGDVHNSGLPFKRVFEAPNLTGYIEPGKTKPKKNIQFEMRGLGMPILARTPKDKPQVNMAVLKEIAGNPFGKKPKYGTAYDFFGGGDAGREACEAIYNLIKLGGIDIMISTFIDPLTVLPDANNRVHCSLNLNTETGRLSARKPNLQNQPALDKDVYKVRAAFAAQPGNRLVVADYGQLELRILAHITKCQSMIEAFKLGGDFHSRTAMGMYPYVREAVEKGEVLLEWDFNLGDPPKPLLKDAYGAERKKAKILNFSIAYGKTATGLAKDWGVSVKEAKQTVNAWYADRPEVLEWQQKTIQEAKRTGVTRTLMGRYRPLHGITDEKGSVRGHAERMAINTPIQGGAADVVMAGMLKLHSNPRLRELGWRILLQIHDELIVEGPEESTEEALAIVVDCMSHPFKKDLLVDLVVDANHAKTWYEGK